MLSVSEPLVMFLVLMRISLYLISLSQHFTCSLIILASTLPLLGQQTVFEPALRAAYVHGIGVTLRLRVGVRDGCQGQRYLQLSISRVQFCSSRG